MPFIDASGRALRPPNPKALRYLEHHAAGRTSAALLMPHASCAIEGGTTPASTRERARADHSAAYRGRPAAPLTDHPIPSARYSCADMPCLPVRHLPTPRL